MVVGIWSFINLNISENIDSNFPGNQAFKSIKPILDRGKETIIFSIALSPGRDTSSSLEEKADSLHSQLKLDLKKIGYNPEYFIVYKNIQDFVDVHVKPLGEALAIENQIYDTVSIPAGDTFVIDAEKLILEDTDEITALASVTLVVTVTVSSIGI